MAHTELNPGKRCAGMLALLLALAGSGSGADTLRTVERPAQHESAAVGSRQAGAFTLIRAEEARRVFRVDGTGLTAAVVDTGLRETHVDFAGKVAARVNFTADGGGAPSDASDAHGHGTNVAGILCANGLHTGVAPGARVVALKVLRDSGAGNLNDVERALNWVLEHHEEYRISVVNLSLEDGSNYRTAGEGSLRGVIRALRQARVAVVAAAGNEYGRYQAQGMTYPAVVPETVSVGALFSADVGAGFYPAGARANSSAPGRVAPFSQRLHPSAGEAYRTDIFAPGAPITSAGILNDQGESTQSGTSQAAPCVAGAILLLQQHYLRAHGELPAVDQLEAWMRGSAVTVNDGDDEDDNVPHTGLDFLRLDAFAALDAVGAQIGTRPPEILSAPFATPNPARLGQTVRFGAAVADASGQPVSCRWDFGDGTAGEGAEAAHYYAAAGNYAVTLAADGPDGTALARLAVEIADVAESGAAFTIEKLAIRVNFSRPHRDSCKLKGRLTAGYAAALAGAQAVLNVGGVEAPFTLNGSGAGRAARGNAMLKMRDPNRFTASLAGQDGAAAWARTGLVNGDVRGGTVSVLVSLSLGERWFADRVGLTYSARTGRSGQAKR